MSSILEVEKAISESVGVKQKLLKPFYLERILAISKLIIQGLQGGKKLLLCGNGGSAADAQHTAAELVNRFKIDRKPIAALALTTDTSVLTSIANDYRYDQIFKKQVEALGQKGDILLALSTSGRSKSVLEAVRTAKVMGLKTVGFTGGVANSLSKLVDIPLQVPSREVARIQESHILIIHIICELIEKKFAHLKPRQGRG